MHSFACDTQTTFININNMIELICKGRWVRIERQIIHRGEHYSIHFGEFCLRDNIHFDNIIGMT